MNKSGNEAPVGSQAFSQRWTETKKSCRHYLSYQDLQHCRPRGTAWPTICLGSAERTALAGYTRSFPADRRRPLTGSCSSSPWALTWRMPQGSILPPLLFNIYAKPPGNMMKYTGSNASHYVDGMQLYVSFPLSCIQHSSKTLSVESKGSMAGRGWSQKR